MTLTYSLVHHQDFLCVDASGNLAFDETKQALRNILDDPNFHSSDEILLDLRNVSCELSVFDVYDLAVFTASHANSPRNKTAVVVGEDDFDLAGFYETCSVNRGVQVQAFTDFQKATDWLGIRPRQHFERCQ